MPIISTTFQQELRKQLREQSLLWWLIQARSTVRTLIYRLIYNTEGYKVTRLLCLNYTVLYSINWGCSNSSLSCRRLSVKILNCVIGNNSTDTTLSQLVYKWIDFLKVYRLPQKLHNFMKEWISLKVMQGEYRSYYCSFKSPPKSQYLKWCLIAHSQDKKYPYHNQATSPSSSCLSFHFWPPSLYKVEIMHFLVS